MSPQSPAIILHLISFVSTCYAGISFIHIARWHCAHVWFLFFEHKRKSLQWAQFCDICQIIDSPSGACLFQKNSLFLRFKSVSFVLLFVVMCIDQNVQIDTLTIVFVAEMISFLQWKWKALKFSTGSIALAKNDDKNHCLFYLRIQFFCVSSYSAHCAPNKHWKPIRCMSVRRR